MKHLKFYILAAAALLAACHGSTVTETVGGTVIGLQTTGTSGNTPLQLQFNGVDTITVTKNGSFVFPKAYDVGTTYFVTVSQQPEGETCSVENSVGILEENVGNVSSVVVNCISTVSSSDAPYGTVSGLSATGTLTLSLNGINPLTITNTNNAAVVAWAFPVALPLGTHYEVALSGQPTGQTCTPAANSVLSGTVTNSSSDPSQQLQPIIITCK
jgi:hypothetical protein